MEYFLYISIQHSLYKNIQLGSHRVAGEENEAWSDPGNRPRSVWLPVPTMPGQQQGLGCVTTQEVQGHNSSSLCGGCSSSRHKHQEGRGAEKKSAFPEHLWVPDTVLNAENTGMH